MTLLAFDLPPWEYVVLFAAIVLGAINKAVEASKRMRQKSIEAEQNADAQFGWESGEAGEPEPELPPRLELARRPRRAEPAPAPEPPPPPRPARAAAPPKPRREHEIVRMLRSPRGARQAVILAEVLRRPGARR